MTMLPVPRAWTTPSSSRCTSIGDISLKFSMYSLKYVMRCVAPVDQPHFTWLASTRVTANRIQIVARIAVTLRDIRSLHPLLQRALANFHWTLENPMCMFTAIAINISFRCLLSLALHVASCQERLTLALNNSVAATTLLLALHVLETLLVFMSVYRNAITIPVWGTTTAHSSFLEEWSPSHLRLPERQPHRAAPPGSWPC